MRIFKYTLYIFLTLLGVILILLDYLANPEATAAQIREEIRMVEREELIKKAR